MAAVLERRTTRAAGWARRLAYFALVLFVISGLGHRFRLVDTESFFSLLGIVATLGMAALACAAWGFNRIWERGDRGGRDCVIGALLALVVLVPFIVSAWQLIALPSLTDISTDVIAPPLMPLAARARSGAMNPIEPMTPADAEMQLTFYPAATGRRYEVAPDLVLQAILRVASQRGWTVLRTPVFGEGQSEVVIEMTAYTTVFAFPVDVAVRIVDEDAAIFVDMRSVSRWGKHDLGDNARRIASFLKDVDAAVKDDPVGN